MAYACNLNTVDMDAGRSGVQDHPQLCSFFQGTTQKNEGKPKRKSPGICMSSVCLSLAHTHLNYPQS